jgi:hypothetical protein
LSAQTYLKPNEKRLFHFETETKQTATFALDTVTKTMYYRQNKSAMLSLEVHDQMGDTVIVFSSHFYTDKGVNEDCIEFINGNFMYSVYDEFDSGRNISGCGIHVKNLKTNKETVIKGIVKTRQGSVSEVKNSGIMSVKKRPRE